MCRWLAYSGSPVPLDELLYKPQSSEIVQGLHARPGTEETTGDGFGVGWYGAQESPGLFRSTEPLWDDRNLRELSGHISSGLVFAHVRVSTGSAVQQTNCHPFRHGRWLWMHNGLIREFTKVKRDLVLEIDPLLYPEIEGTTDSEVFFHLALTYGLEHDPPAAVERAVGVIEETAARHGVKNALQMTVATTDGRSVWAFRYSSDGKSRSLSYSTDANTLRQQHDDSPVLQGVSDGSRLVVSEPLGKLAGAWSEVPESSYGVIQEGEDVLLPFRPRTPRVSTARASMRGAVATE